MSLVRFDGDDVRGPTAQLWHGVVDWVRGSLATALGQRDFEDYAPYRGVDVEGGDAEINSCTQVSGTSGIAAAFQEDRFGVVNIAASAGADAAAGLARRVFYDIEATPVTVVEARIDQNADANSPQAFVGLSDVANPDDVFGSGVIAASGNSIGLRWNVDETIDIVAVVGGTLTVLKDDIGLDLVRTDGFGKLGLRIEKVTTSLYRLVPSVNGVIARSGIVNVANTAVPEGEGLRPVIATTVDTTTAVSLDVDYIYSADK